MARAPLPMPTRRSAKSPVGGRRWSSSTSGCRGAGSTGLRSLDEVKKEHAELPVIMISGHGNIETAVSAIKRGAYDYIEKPFKSDRLVLVAERALEASKLRREVKALRERAGEARQLLGASAAMNHLRTMIEKVAPTNSRIMISGASGAGKELVARAIHELSTRKQGPFVVLNAATITPERMEHELFGTEPSNGDARKVGALEEAHGGTLYLDEVGDMPRETQNKILRVLVDQTFPARRRHQSRHRRCPHHLFDRPRSRARDRRRAHSVRICSIAWRSCRCACRRSPSGARTFRCSSAISSSRFRGRPACRRGSDRRRRHGGAAGA